MVKIKLITRKTGKYNEYISGKTILLEKNMIIKAEPIYEGK